MKPDKEEKKTVKTKETKKEEKFKMIDVIIRETGRDLTTQMMDDAKKKVEKQYGKDYELKQIIGMPVGRFFFWFRVKVKEE